MTRKFDLWHSFHYLDDYTEPWIARLSGARAWVCTKKNMNWNDRSWRLRCGFAQGIVAQNQDMMSRFFSSRRARRKTRLIPRGVDTRRFHPEGAARDLRSELGLGAESLLVACVAHLVPAKGVEVLLHALADLDHAWLVVAGRAMDAAYEERLKTLTKDLGMSHRVRFLGAVEDIAALQRGVDVFVLPTLATGRQEGCPVALLEAMACGRACIATEIPGSRDLLAGGEAGILVPPGNAEALARALLDLSGHPEARERLGHVARRRAEEQYAIDLEVDRHQKFYDQVLAR